MRTLSIREIEMVSAAKAAIQTLTPTLMEIIVTYASKFVASGTYGGHRLNVILYANAVHDVYDRALPYDFSKPFSINGNLTTAIAVEGGHIYRIAFDEG